ncbi:MAG: Sec-independent protein translocase subunit TatA [Rickettsiales bacterium]|nr:Sec-independent protein translocase subunit TatA [Rickettsiales bacterium]
MGMSFWHLLLILIVVFTLFGAGKLPKVMGDVGKGIRSLREGLKGEDETAAKTIEQKDPNA